MPKIGDKWFLIGAILIVLISVWDTMPWLKKKNVRFLKWSMETQWRNGDEPLSLQFEYPPTEHLPQVRLFDQFQNPVDSTVLNPRNGLNQEIVLDNTLSSGVYCWEYASCFIQGGNNVPKDITLLIPSQSIRSNLSKSGVMEAKIHTRDPHLEYVRHFFRTFEDYNVGVISDEGLTEMDGALNSKILLLFGLVNVIPEALHEKLKNFVESGGHLLVLTPYFMLDKNPFTSGRHRRKPWDKESVESLIGVSYLNTVVADDPSLDYDGQTYTLTGVKRISGVSLLRREQWKLKPGLEFLSTVSDTIKKRTYTIVGGLTRYRSNNSSGIVMSAPFSGWHKRPFRESEFAIKFTRNSIDELLAN